MKKSVDKEGSNSVNGKRGNNFVGKKKNFLNERKSGGGRSNSRDNGSKANLENSSGVVSGSLSQGDKIKGNNYWKVLIFCFVFVGVILFVSASDYLWWNEDFDNSLELNISNPLSENLINHSFLLNITGSQAIFSNLLSEGSDIRFVFYNESLERYFEVPFWIEKFSQSSSYDSSINSSFNGSYYDYGPTYYSTPSATFSRKTRPMAIHYEGVHNRTYFVWGAQGTNAPTIAYYDHIFLNFSSPTIVDNLISTSDAHITPSLLIDNSGNVFVFYGAHGSTTYVKKSSNPEGISSWEERSEITGNTSYAQPWVLNETHFFLSLRIPNTNQSYFLSEDGLNWTHQTHIIGDSNADRAYLLSMKGKESIHFAWSIFDSAYTGTYNPFRYDVHYFYLNISDMNFYNISGNLIEIPVPENDSRLLVYDSEATKETIKVEDIEIDENDVPWILFSASVGNDSLPAAPTVYKIAHWDSSWLISNITTVDNRWDAGTLVVHNSSNVKAYIPGIPSQEDEDGGEIQEFSSSDGLTWTNTWNITSNSDYSHNYPKTVYNSTSDLRIFWSYGDSDRDNSPSGSSLYGWGERFGVVPLGSSLNIDSLLAWIKVPSLNRNSNTTFYLYSKNNSEVSSKSNISNAFYFGDDFSGENLDESRWDLDGSSGTWSQGSEIISGLDDGSGGYLWSQIPMPSSFKMISRCKTSSYYSPAIWFGNGSGSPVTESNRLAYYVEIFSDNLKFYYNSTSISKSISNLLADSFYRSNFIKKDDYVNITLYKVFGLSFIDSFSQIFTNEPSGYYFAFRIYDELLSCDYIAVTNFSLEPEIYYGSENFRLDLFPTVSIFSPTSGQSVTSSSLSLSIQTNENSTCNYSTDGGTTNSSLTANSTGTGHTGTLSSLSTGSYALNIYCSDLFGNANNSESVSFSVSIASSSTSTTTTSGSPSTSGPSGSSTFVYNSEQVQSGFSKDLKSGQSVKTEVKSSEKIINVNEVTSGKAVVEIEGKSYSVDVDSSVKVDLDNDGVYDLEISNSGSSTTGLGDFANLEFREISEDVESENQEEQKENVFDKIFNSDKEDGEKEISFWKHLINFLKEFWERGKRF